MPVSYYLIGAFFQYAFTLLSRFGYRFLLLTMKHHEKNFRFGVKGARIMIVGAGQAGRLLLRDIKESQEIHDRTRCFIDDNPNKWGRYIDGVKIIGGRDRIQDAVKKYNIDKIYLAIPSATAKDRRDILNLCKETGCELRNLPGVFQLVNGDVRVSALKEVNIEDLLGRDPIRVDLQQIFEEIKGKTILVTGGGDSIGSELCRQIAAHEPRQLILFDIYENSAYTVQLELKKRFPQLNLVTLIGSVRDSRKLWNLFETYHPDRVYHAAAHKHVPLMEDSPCEAIKNNAIGTYKTAYAAMAHGVQKFVLISTDKAVNPTNIMGASKRLCEMIIQAFDARIRAGRATEIPQLFTHPGEPEVLEEEVRTRLRRCQTEFVAVRFGNVLGSNGSVIPIFKKQIAEHRPVTVTHPDIIRYFMTIPEAVSLVLQAGAYAHGGEIFVLDMGEPVKIDTLARNLIKLSGLRPDEDIQVVYTGLRPGEKLYEEKLMSEEGLKRTDNDLIHIGTPIPFDISVFLSKMQTLMDAAYKNKANIRDYVKEMVSTYHPAGDEPERLQQDEQTGS